MLEVSISVFLQPGTHNLFHFVVFHFVLFGATLCSAQGFLLALHSGITSEGHRVLLSYCPAPWTNYLYRGHTQKFGDSRSVLVMLGPDGF